MGAFVLSKLVVLTWMLRGDSTMPKTNVSSEHDMVPPYASKSRKWKYHNMLDIRKLPVYKYEIETYANRTFTLAARSAVRMP